MACRPLLDLVAWQRTTARRHWFWIRDARSGGHWLRAGEGRVGKGYATEALTAIVQLARDIGVRRLKALCHPEHRNSWHVLEKCGFVRDSTWSKQVEFPNLAPGVPQDVVCYEMLFADRERRANLPKV